jgi:hypothetical protein
MITNAATGPTSPKMWAQLKDVDGNEFGLVQE